MSMSCKERRRYQDLLEAALLLALFVVLALAGNAAWAIVTGRKP